jgi:truncated hemoglobin YjbI
MDKELQREYGRLGGLTTRARHDGRKITEAARRAAEARFYAGLDDVPEPERTRRAQAARAAHFQRLTILGIQAKRERKRRQEQCGWPWAQEADE